MSKLGLVSDAAVGGLKRGYCAGVLALAVSGCAMPTEDGESEDVATTQQQQVVAQWAPVFSQSRTMGMAINVNGIVFTWTDILTNQSLGFGCKGDFISQCSGGTFFYTSAVPPSLIRGVGIGATDGKVYAWYRAGNVASWSKGTSVNLGALQPFLLPANVNIDQLIDAEQTTGGTWHYWWRMADGTIRVSRSNSPSTGGTFINTVVNALPVQALDIAGIGVFGGNPNTVVTWWQKDNVNSFPVSFSTSDLDLLQN